MSADYRRGSYGRRSSSDPSPSDGPPKILILLAVILVGGASAWFLRDRLSPSTSDHAGTSADTSIPGPDERVEDFSLPGPAKPAEYRAALEQALKNNDVCRIITELRPEARPDIPADVLLEVFFETVSTMRPARETTSFRKILSGLLEGDPKNAIERLRDNPKKNPRLYLALVQSGQMDGLPLESDRESYRIIDYSNASAALRQLSSEHPDNSAFTFFLAGIRHRMHASDSEIERLFMDGFQARHFKTALYKVARELGRLSGESEAHAILATILQGMIPAPNYNEPADLLIRMIGSGSPAFAKQALGFGRKIMAINEPYLRAVPNPIRGVREEYQTGARISQAAWERLHAGVSFRDRGPDDLRSTLILETAADWDAKWTAAMTDSGRSPASECSKAGILSLLRKQRQEFAEFHRDYLKKWE